MAAGDIILFDEYSREAGEKIHKLDTDVLKLGLINNVAPPDRADNLPSWNSYAVNEVDAITAEYPTGGVTIGNSSWTEAGGVSTYEGNSFTIAQNASGFTNGFWGILYNSTATGLNAIGFLEMGGPVSQVAGDVVIKWNGVASGAKGAIFTHRTPA
jgi:hypothetical protein